MTQQQIEQFRKEFKHIVWIKGEITEAKNRIVKLTRFDNNGSHSKAIREAIDECNKITLDFTGKLKGHTYNDWKEFSKKISAVKSKLKPVEQRYNRVLSEMNALVFEF